MKQELAILKSARDIIAQEENWCQGFYCRKANGDYISLCLWKSANQFCPYGALYVASTEDGTRKMNTEIVEKAARFLTEHIPRPRKTTFHSLTEYNDEHTHDEMLTVFDLAIKSLEENQQKLRLPAYHRR